VPRERVRETEYAKIHINRRLLGPSSTDSRLIGDKRLITRRKLQPVPYLAAWRYKLSALYREISGRKAREIDSKIQGARTRIHLDRSRSTMERIGRVYRAMKGFEVERSLIDISVER